MSVGTLTRGGFTMPTEVGMEKTVVELSAKWGADAIRDSDGTQLSDDLLALGYEVFSTLCIIRADQTWAGAHREHLQQKYLQSDPVAARANTLEIEIMKGYFAEQFEPDTIHDPAKWWEVVDRTTCGRRR